jgi:hypothetical protein
MPIIVWIWITLSRLTVSPVSLGAHMKCTLTLEVSRQWPLRRRCCSSRQTELGAAPRVLWFCLWSPSNLQAGVNWTAEFGVNRTLQTNHPWHQLEGVEAHMRWRRRLAPPSQWQTPPWTACHYWHFFGDFARHRCTRDCSVRWRHHTVKTVDFRKAVLNVQSVQWLGWPLDDPGFESRQGQEFIFLQQVQIGCGAHPASHAMHIKPSFLGVKRPGRETDYLHPASADVKNEWISTSTPCICLDGFYADNFNFTGRSASSLSITT